MRRNKCSTTKLHPRAHCKTDREEKTKRFRHLISTEGEMSPAVEKELCFAKFQDTFVQSFLHKDDVIPPVPPTSLEEGGDGSAEQKTCEMMTDPRVFKTFLPKELQKP